MPVEISCVQHVPLCPGQPANEGQQIVSESKKAKGSRNACIVFITLLDSLLIYDCVIYFQLSFIFTITTYGSYLSFPLWCQSLKVNTSEMRAGKDIKKAKELPWGTQRETHLPYMWVGLRRAARREQTKGCPGTRMSLYAQLMLTTDFDGMSLSEPESGQLLCLWMF